MTKTLLLSALLLTTSALACDTAPTPSEKGCGLKGLTTKIWWSVLENKTYMSQDKKYFEDYEVSVRIKRGKKVITRK